MVRRSRWRHPEVESVRGQGWATEANASDVVEMGIGPRSVREASEVAGEAMVAVVVTAVEVMEAMGMEAGVDMEEVEAMGVVDMGGTTAVWEEATGTG
jgi:hypothetical protein